MKYIIGSIIIIFGVIVVGLIWARALQIKLPSNGLENIVAAWVFFAILSYPLARNIVR
jgi:hypothetical protein